MIDSASSSNVGERLTFLQLFTDKAWQIEVPIIQRDYAQGRPSATEIRDTFLNSLKEHLDNSKNIDLDFVYGSISEIDNFTFIPLDGQQRLTTLFLLHWYLANLEGKKKEFDQALLVGKKSKFTYRTRTSSGEFCDALLFYGVDLTNLLSSDDKKNNSLSKTIIDSAWYFSAWGIDPTIQSMLAMLDAIHGRFNVNAGYFDKLVKTENPIITFQFLNLNEFKLTDDLYIKMNARGKQLTPFENFKANLEQHIADLNIPSGAIHRLVSDIGEKSVSVKEYFSHKIDTDWANLFWKFKNTKDNTYDAQLMNFIRVVITNHFVLKCDADELIYLRFLIGKEDANEKDREAKPITYVHYKALKCLDKELILNLTSILDIVEENEQVKVYLPDNIYFKEEQILNDVIKNRLNYTERLQFYAFYQYLIVNGSVDGLLEWMRVIHNLTENSIYNNAEQFARSLKSIQSLLPHSMAIINYVADVSNPIAGFVEIQITEERIKALLFKRSEDWKTAILEIENHGYFNGQIGFILNFSGIEAYYAANKNCNWSEVNNDNFMHPFKVYSEKANSVFGDSGLREIPKSDINDFNTWEKQYLWERALLTKGDYLLRANSNKSFLIDRDRDISWKTLLRDENPNEGFISRRGFVKEVFDDMNFDMANVANSLREMIESSEVDDWRKHFIEVKEVIANLGTQRYIRLNGEGSIYLLRKLRMSGPHAEYFSFAFYVKYFPNITIVPFTRLGYYWVSGDDEDDPACAYMKGWCYGNDKYELAVCGHSSTKLEVLFHNTSRGAISMDICNVLTEHSFKFNKYWYGLVVSFDLAFDLINTICKEFNELNNKI